MSTTMAAHQPDVAGASRQTTPGMVLGIAAIIFAAHVPLMFVHFQQLWLKPHYQLFPVVIGLAFVLVWPLGNFSYAKSPGAIRYGIALTLAGTLLVGVGMLIDASPDLAIIGTPDLWVAAGSLTLFAAIPTTIFCGLGSVLTINSNPGRGAIVGIVSWLLLTLAVFFGSPSAATALAIVLTGALAITIGGQPLFRRCLPALLFLFLIVPPPFMMDTILVQKMQLFASHLSSKILDQMGVYHYLTGVIIDVGIPPPLGVVDACSGISSLLTTLACVLFYVIYFRVHWLRGTLLTLSSIVWVIVNNSLRIIGIAYFRVKWDINLSSGLPHFLFGILLFALTLMLIWSTDRLLMFFGRSDVTRRRYEPVTIASDAAHKGMLSLFGLSKAFYQSVPMAVLFGLVLAVQVAEYVAIARRVPYSGSALSKLYEKMDVDVLPNQVQLWQRADKIQPQKREAGNPLGEFSQVWVYSRNQGRARCVVSLDYPYPEFHDLRVCYSNNGWQLHEPTIFRHETSDGLAPLHCVRVAMVRPVERYGYLWFCEFDQDGMGQDPVGDPLTADTIPQRIATRISFAGARWQRIFMPTPTAASTGLGSILQVQLFFETKQQKSDAELDVLQQLFLEGAEKLRAKCVALKSGKQ